MKEKIKIFLVDDDVVFLKSLEIEFLQNKDIEVHLFTTGEKCLEYLHLTPNVIILDYKLDGIVKGAMTGIEVLDIIKLKEPDIPVVMLSAQDKIEVAVDCMHHHSFDYVVKSETAFIRLQKIIITICKYKKMEKELKWYISKM